MYPLGVAVFLSCYLATVSCLFSKSDTDIIVNITVSFAATFKTGCINFLYNEEDIQDHFVFDIYKGLSNGLQNTRGIYTYHNILRTLDKKQYRMTCSFPIRLLIDTSGTKEKFITISRELRISDSIWLVILNSTVQKFMSDIKVTFDMKLVLASIKDKDLVEFHEVYRVDDDYPLRILKLGRWTRRNGLDVPQTNMYGRRFDLEGKQFRTGSIENWPMSSFDGGVWDGYFPRIWRELEVLTNSTSKAYKSKDQSTGSKNENGSWTGLMGMVLNNEIDIIVSEITINEERSSVIKFSRPVLISRYQVYTTYRMREQFEWNTIFQPFSRGIWFVLGTWIVVGTLSTTALFYCSWTYGLDADSKKLFCFTETFFFVLQSLSQQGTPELPISSACRIIVFISFLTSTVLVNSYSASILSSITHKRVKNSFSNLQDFLNDGSQKLLVLPRTGQYSVFKNSKYHPHKDIFRKLVRTKLPSGLEIKGISDVLDNVFCKVKNYAFFTVDKIFQMKEEHTPTFDCPLISLAEPLTPVFQCLGFTKDSPYYELMNYKLHKLFDMGIISRIEWSLRQLKRSRRSPIFTEVDIDDIFQIFALLLVGIIASIVLLTLEKCYYKKKQSIQRISKERENLHKKKNPRFSITFPYHIR